MDVGKVRAGKGLRDDLAQCSAADEQVRTREVTLDWGGSVPFESMRIWNPNPGLMRPSPCALPTALDVSRFFGGNSLALVFVTHSPPLLPFQSHCPLTVFTPCLWVSLSCKEEGQGKTGSPKQEVSKGTEQRPLSHNQEIATRMEETSILH